MNYSHRYRWAGVNSAGQAVQGCLEAKTPTLAKILLHKQGVTTQKISKERPFGLRASSRIKPSDITQFIRKMASLLSAQVPLTQALELLTSGEENHRLKCLLRALQCDVQSGLSLADALRKHSKHFNALTCHLIQAGEQSGTLTIILSKLAHYQEDLDNIQKKLHATLAYPLAILAIAACVTTGLLVFVVPQFQELFESFNASLPAFTQSIISLSHGIKHYGLALLAFMFGSAYSFRALYKKSTRLALIYDRLLLNIPLVGKMLHLTIITRFSQTLAILLSAGTPLVEALSVSSNIANNLRYTHAIQSMRDDIIEGHALKHALEETRLFPSLMVQLVGIGETSGRLEAMLTHLAKQHDEALRHTLQTLSSLFEPCLMALLGLWVGSLIVAMYLPIFQLGAIVS